MSSVGTSRAWFLVTWFVAGSAGCNIAPNADAAEPARAKSPEARVETTRSAHGPPAAASPSASCPQEMVPIAGACIDRYEAHLMVRAADGTLERHPHYERPPSDRPFFAASAKGVLPQGYISRVEAAAACEAAGKRLCSAKEWSMACRGEPAVTYGYGSKFEPGRCNVGRPHLLSRLYGENPNAWRYDEHFNSPLLLKEPKFLAPAGQFEGCSSSVGAHDMVGNLHEWVADTAGPSLAEKIPMIDMIRRTLRRSAGKGVFMGGFFSTTKEHGRGCEFVTIAHEPRYHDYSTGFRCCR